MKKNMLFFVLVAVCIVGLLIETNVTAQYGLYGNLYGLSGSLGTTYGMGVLYGSSYGGYGLGDLYGSVFGGYGVYGGLYGTGGLYGLSGLSGTSYGLNSLTGGLYGMGGMYGMGLMNPLNALLAQQSAPPTTAPANVINEPAATTFDRLQAVPLPALAPVPTVAVAPPPVPIVIVTTNWVGSWYILNTSASTGPQTGTMILQLTQNTQTGQLDGLVDFGATNVVPVPVPVTGVLLPGVATFDLDGIYFDPLVGSPANINLVCTLTSSTTMSGTLNIISWKGINFGEFYLTLI
jgi:hypothetical protein